MSDDRLQIDTAAAAGAGQRRTPDPVQTGRSNRVLLLVVLAGISVLAGLVSSGLIA